MDSGETPKLPVYAGQVTVEGKALDVSDIHGNVSKDMKRESLYVFRHFMTSVNIWREGGEARAETIFEITVEKDMCNILGTLHGACAAYIVDPCSVSSLVVLGRAKGIDGTGVSQSMNLIWHHPVRLGTRLRIVSTSMSLKGRVRTARCELWDGDSLCVSAVHSTVNPGQKRTKGRM